ncbi:MAG: YggT family protein [Acidimicrobiales bacterium]
MGETRATVAGLRFAKVLVWLVYAFFVLAVVILTLAFILLLFNASPTAEFTQWVYRSANRLLEPFRGIFPSTTFGNGSVFDFAVLFAIIMYGLFALAVNALVRWIDQGIRHEEWKQARPAPAPVEYPSVPPSGEGLPPAGGPPAT